MAFSGAGELFVIEKASGQSSESETLLFGRDFGVTPDLQSSPDETLYVVSLSKGAIFESAER